MNLKKLAKEAYEISESRRYGKSDYITINKNCQNPNCRNNVHYHECPNGVPGDRFKSELKVNEGFSKDPIVNKAENEAYQAIEKISLELQKKYKVQTYVTVFDSGNLETSIRIDIGKPW